MRITIAYLYYDLLNLYGENGNIKILKKQLEQQGIKVTVKFLTTTDSLSFSDYDLVYFGMGTENNQKIALKHLIPYQNDIKNSIEDGKFFLITGNSLELFGDYILDKKGTQHEALQIFPFYSKEEDFRMIDEVIMKAKGHKNLFIGFQNQGSVIRGISDPFFEVIKGIGSFPNSTHEGFAYQNFLGTYMVGPLLVRNPHYLKYFIKKLVHSKNPKFKWKKIDLSWEKEAYDQYLKQRMQTETTV